jgi:hypothetical protein
MEIRNNLSAISGDCHPATPGPMLSDGFNIRKNGMVGWRRISTDRRCSSGWCHVARQKAERMPDLSPFTLV